MDLIHRREKADWLAVGWFTPDYRPLADKLTANLQNHTPYHLYQVEPFGSSFYERTRKKPEIVLRAMDDYPGKTIILMDVDCIVKGDISGLPGLMAGDVGICLRTRQEKHPRVSMAASSRVVVFKPTEGARKFAQAWYNLCTSPEGKDFDDELCMVWTYATLGNISYSHLPLEYAAREDCHSTAEAIITHSSENGRRTFRVGLRSFLKGIEKRYFRTGRTRNNLDARQKSIQAGLL